MDNRHPYRPVLIAFVLGALLVAGTAGAADPAGMPDFERGVAAYQSGHYEAARSAFEAARRQGLHNPNLELDLGLSYYKLERYADAQAAFQRLRGFPGYQGVADFHLGLVAARAGEKQRAAELWRALATDAADANLRERARVALGRLEPGAAPRVPGAYLLGALGYDTNPALIDQSPRPRNSKSAYAELYGAFNYPLATAPSTATLFNGGGYLRNFFVNNGLDQSGLFAGLSRGRITGGRQVAASLDAATVWLDGAHFADMYSLEAQGGPARGAGGVTLRGQASWIAAAPDFSYLEGWRLRTEARWDGPRAPTRLHAGYQFEFNDRADFTATGNQFFSHSPLRHRLTVALDHPLGERWALREMLRYRSSRYRDPSRFLQGGVLVEERRTENLFRAGVQARRQIARRANLLLEYEYSHNTASIGAFAYERHVASVGIEWLPRWP